MIRFVSHVVYMYVIKGYCAGPENVHTPPPPVVLIDIIVYFERWQHNKNMLFRDMTLLFYN